ncbi:MAG TPA: exodeoxyribonuclease VII large subunit [Gemmatimonadales bacterium]|nr:exodeoxyribonuclease VII large subunit [Gemmatimonadales bacterium]
MTDLFSRSDQPAEGALTVAELDRRCRRLLEGEIGPTWVKGEVSGLKAYQSGHWYFTLKDQDAQIRCVMWRANAVKAGPPPADGAQVFLFGTPTVWEERGEFRLTVTRLLALEGVGAQQLAFERTKKALEKDGLFDPARKRALPAFARTVAVVTSLDGAALHDIITVARKRWPAVRLIAIGTKVQGGEAEAEVVAALKRVDRLDGVDVCIVGRGGGAREDLEVFNREAVCRALAAVRVPTVSAVGHETDISLTDLVADVRAATPSAAAELVVPDRAIWWHRAQDLATRLAGALTQRGRLARERLARSADRLEAALDDLLLDRRRHADRLAAQLDALSPLKVLGRGYAVPTGAEGRVLKTVADFGPGAPFTLRVSDGSVPARVEPT